MKGKDKRCSASVGAGWESQAWRSDSFKPFGADSAATLAAKLGDDAPAATVEIFPRTKSVIAARISTLDSSFLLLSPSSSMSPSSIPHSSLRLTSTAPIASPSWEDYITSVNNKKRSSTTIEV